jgi:ABC-2 type transport system permease protein
VPVGIPDSLTMPEQPITARMLAIADGDVLKNQVDPADHSPFPLGWDRYTQRHYGNKTFLLNAIDYLAGQEETIALREKEVKLRLLDQIKIQKTKLTWQLLNVALPPVLLIITGLIQQSIRRKKYGTDYTG